MADENLLLVFSNPTEGNEATYNEWYDRTHLRDVLAVPGVVAAQRYDLAEIKPPEMEGMPSLPPPAHRYLARYELDRDPDEVMAEFLRRLTTGEMVLDDSLDMSTVSMTSWQPRGARLTAPSTTEPATQVR